MRQIKFALPRWDVPQELELHAEQWVNNRSLFPPDSYAAKRIRALEYCLLALGRCEGVALLHVLADTSQPHLAGGVTRVAIWEHLLLDFEAWLATRMRGQVIFDRNAPAQVVAVARRLRKQRFLRAQPLEPVDADSRDHPELQFADLCAYFLLQQVSPNKHIAAAGAQNRIDDLAHLNLFPTHSTTARVVWL